MSKIILDRTLFKQIKAMNKESMSNFLTNVYMNGKKDAATCDVDLEQLKRDVGGIKGIGEKRLDQIMLILNKYLK